jgi:hypothetical protein
MDALQPGEKLKNYKKRFEKMFACAQHLLHISTPHVPFQIVCSSPLSKGGSQGAAGQQQRCHVLSTCLMH